MIPLFRHLYNNSKQGLEAEKLVKIALELVQARKESGQKVSKMLTVCDSHSDAKTFIFLAQGYVATDDWCNWWREKDFWW